MIRGNRRGTAGVEAVMKSALATLPLLLAVLTGCGDAATDPGTDGGTGPATVEVTVADWTGWSRDQPEPTSFTRTLEEGDSFEADMLGDRVTFTVEDLGSDEISWTTSEDLSLVDGGTVSLRDTTDRFEQSRGETLEVGTPSMDGGTHVSVRWE